MPSLNKLSFPTPATGKQHAGLITTFRAALLRLAAGLDLAGADAAEDVRRQWGTLADKYGIVEPAPEPDPDIGLVQNTQTIAVQNSAGAAIDNAVATVANSAVSYVRLPATTAAVKNGNTFAVTGGTVTATVTAGVATFAFTATA